jgi:hypothetical protein
MSGVVHCIRVLLRVYLIVVDVVVGLIQAYAQNETDHGQNGS